MQDNFFYSKCCHYLKYIAVLAIIFIVFSFIHSIDIKAILLKTIIWIRIHDELGPIVYILIYIIFGLFCLPTSVLTFAAGVLYGTLKGTILAYAGALIGASCSFCVGRYLARNWVIKRIEKYPKFKIIDEAIGREGSKIVLLARLSPLFPYCIMNYCFSLTKVSFKDFFIGSLGMLFWTAVYAYSGSLIGKLLFTDTVDEVNISDPNYLLLKWIVRIVGLAATVFVTLYISKIAGNSLKNELHE